MLNLILGQVFPGDGNLVAVSFNQVLPKLYAVSMMWTLNARYNMRLSRERTLLSETSSGRRVRSHFLHLCRDFLSFVTERKYECGTQALQPFCSGTHPDGGYKTYRCMYGSLPLS